MTTASVGRTPPRVSQAKVTEAVDALVEARWGAVARLHPRQRGELAGSWA